MTRASFLASDLTTRSGITSNLQLGKALCDARLLLHDSIRAKDSMAGRKRKRAKKPDSEQNSAKRMKSGGFSNQKGVDVHHSPIPLYYQNVSSLRDYLLSRKHDLSNSGRRRVLSLLLHESAPTPSVATCAQSHGLFATDASSSSPDHSEALARKRLLEKQLSNLLDTTAVGYQDAVNSGNSDAALVEDFNAFSQKLHSPSKSTVSSAGCYKDCSVIQAEVCALGFQCVSCPNSGFHLSNDCGLTSV